MKINPLCFSLNKYNRLYILFSVSALFLGGIIYVLFHTSEPVFFAWMHATASDGWLGIIRQRSLSAGSHLPQWIVSSLPDGLWAFAYALLITGIWRGSKSWLRYFWMCSIPIVVIGFEALQFAGLIRGTFSVQDLIFGIIGLLIGIYTGIITTKPHNHEKSAI